MGRSGDGVGREPAVGTGRVGGPPAGYGAGMTATALAPLLDLPDVAAALDRARLASDAALRHRAMRRSAAALGTEVSLRAAVASAQLEGHSHDLADVRAGTVTDPVVQGALRAIVALPSLATTWRVAPRQVLARLHVLAARGCAGVDDTTLGRPSASAPVLARLDQLLAVVTAPAAGVPALLRAAVVHGELLALPVGGSDFNDLRFGHEPSIVWMSE